MLDIHQPHQNTNHRNHLGKPHLQNHPILRFQRCPWTDILRCDRMMNMDPWRYVIQWQTTTARALPNTQVVPEKKHIGFDLV